MAKGAVSISGPKELKDENGTVIMASIRTVDLLITKFFQKPLKNQ